MFDMATVKVILEGIPILGASVVVLTGIIKLAVQKLFKTSNNWTGYLSSAVASAGSTMYYLLANHAFTWYMFAGYALLVFAAANKLFKEIHPETPSSDTSATK